LAMMRQSEDAISKAVLGGTLTSTTSQSGGGAFALGQVHNEVRHDLLASDARQLAATLSRDLLWPLLVLNRPGSPDVRRAPR
ncbi:phage portal protein family protein, partial [Streptococcus pyogenes]